jgi:DNA-binding LytR/AlgR family response regulator
MSLIQIVLLEDNAIDALKVKLMLEEFKGKHQYQLKEVFKLSASLIAYTEVHEVDIVIADIFIGTRPAGIEVLQHFQKRQIPVILLTNSEDKELYAKAQQYSPVHYLIKPFHSLTLLSILEKVVSELELRKQKNLTDRKFLYLSGVGGQREQVWLDDIIYLSSESNYCFIHTSTKKYTVKKSLTKMLSESLGDGFLRIHQKYVVNKIHLKSIKQDTVIMNTNLTLSIGKIFKKSVLNFTKVK